MNALEIRELIVKALKGKTDAGDNVHSPRDWPTHVDDFTVLLVSSPHDKKGSLGRHAPQFDTVTTVRVEGRLVAYDKKDGTSGAGAAMAALETLRLQVEKAVINNPEIMPNIQQFISVESQTSLDSDGEGHIGQVAIHFDVEYYQGPEDFYPLEADEIHEMEIQHKTPEGTEPTGVIIQFER